MNKSQYTVAIGARPFADQSRGFVWAFAGFQTGFTPSPRSVRSATFSESVS